MMHSKDNIFMRNATGIAVGAITVLIVLAVSMFSQQNEASNTAKALVSHTYDVTQHVQLAMSKLKDTELGHRGYLTTGEEEFLDPYKDALAESQNGKIDEVGLDRTLSVRQIIGKLRVLTKDNPVQQENLDQMEEITGKLLAYIKTSIEARKDNAGLDYSKSFHHSKILMDRLRGLTRSMIAEENHLLKVRISADEAITKRGLHIMYASLLVFYIALACSIFIYQRSRARAQAQMLDYTHELERSEEELKQQQEELRASNEEIEASNEELEETSRKLEEQNTQIKRQSEALQESKRIAQERSVELERASRYKSEFLANMSHELRTPLNSLLILARSLANNEEGNLTVEQVEEARVIHNGGLELLTLINDILDLSKVEAGKLNFIAQDTPIINIVKSLRQQFEPVAKQSGITFDVSMANDLPKMLHTDGQRVEQIIKNLLSNAFKFTQKGSVTLTVQRPDDRIGLQRDSLNATNSVAFMVKDTGIGIETSKFKDIFEAFQQEDGSTDRHYGGTGLGLTIARKFAHIMGGEIHVASAKGEGSTFTLVLPLHAESHVSDDSYTVEGTDGDRIPLRSMPRAEIPEFIADDRRNIGDKDKVLLIIEDDKYFAATLMKISHARGYKCLVAGDGKTGLLFATEHNVTAIILDLILPDIDGIQVLDQLKHNLSTRHIPVHIISARNEGDTSVPLRKGAVGYLAKPADKESIDAAFGKMENLLESDVKEVLVVEDDKKNQVAIQSLLKKKDIRITISGTGSEALEQTKKTRFDCIILDLRLPDMSGFEWLEKLEQETGDEGLPPVIVYTAKELNAEENRQLSRFTGSIIIKGAKSPERLLDEVTLFLHSVESTLSEDQKDMIRMQHDPDKALQGRTVLLVDDDLRNTFALSKLLKKRGMQVIIADNGRMALDKLQESAGIDLVIMDIMMPVMDGYQAMREIRSHDKWRDLPVIALTARAMPEEQGKCMEAGANDYLTKPVDTDRLLMLLRVWLFKQELAA